MKGFKYLFLLSLIMILTIPFKIYAEETEENWKGILDSENFTISDSKGIHKKIKLEGAWDNVNDLSWKYCAYIANSHPGYFVFDFEKEQDIGSFKLCKGLYCTMYTEFYDRDNKLMKTIFTNYGEDGLGHYQIFNYDINLEGVKKVKIVNRNYYDVLALQEIEFFQMPPTMGDLAGTYDTTISRINLSWNDLGEGVTYKLFLNNSLVETFDNATLNHTFEDLISNTSYEVKILASKEGFRDSIFVDNIKTLNFFSFPPTNPNSNVGDTWISVKWSGVNEAVGYQVQIDDGEIINIDDLNYRFTNLKPDTNYTVKIRTVFEGGLYSEWKVMEIRTLPPPEVPPYKPDRLDILENGYNSIKVEVSKTLYADSYVWYLNSRKISETVERIFVYEGLKESTSYTLSCKPKNEFGESRFGAVRLVTTLEIQKPRVTSVKTENAGYSGSGGINKKLTWEGKNVNQGYEVWIDGKKVADYDVDTTSSVIDYDKLGLEDGFHDIEIKPKDPNGIGYRVKVTNKGTGNEDIDNVVGKIDTSLQHIKKGGLYLLILLIIFSISMFGALFLFNKFKLGLVTTTPEQIESDPDQAMTVDKKDRHVLDKQVKQIADNIEDRYYERKKEEKEVKRITNKVPAYRMKDKKQMIVRLSSGHKRVEIDDFGKYLEHAKLSKYDKQMLKNAVEDWNKKSQTKQFFHISSNNKKLSLGGYIMKESNVEGGGKNDGKSPDEVIRAYEARMMKMVADRNKELHENNKG